MRGGESTPAGRIVGIHGRNISIITLGQNHPITLPSLTVRGLDLAGNLIGHSLEFEVIDGQLQFTVDERRYNPACLCHREEITKKASN